MTKHLNKKFVTPSSRRMAGKPETFPACGRDALLGEAEVSIALRPIKKASLFSEALVTPSGFKPETFPTRGSGCQ
jgi:hypothetical protein